MALDDITYDNVISGFMMELPQGALNAPLDILYPKEMCIEFPEKSGETVYVELPGIKVTGGKGKISICRK